MPSTSENKATAASQLRDAQKAKSPAVAQIQGVNTATKIRVADILSWYQS